MARCVICKNFYPPGFTEPTEDKKYHKCEFCIKGKDRIMKHDKVTGDLFYDVKDEIVNKYKMYLNELAKNTKARESLYRNIKR